MHGETRNKTRASNYRKLPIVRLFRRTSVLLALRHDVPHRGPSTVSWSTAKLWDSRGGSNGIASGPAALPMTLFGRFFPNVFAFNPRCGSTSSRCGPLLNWLNFAQDNAIYRLNNSFFFVRERSFSPEKQNTPDVKNKQTQRIRWEEQRSETPIYRW